MMTELSFFGRTITLKSILQNAFVRDLSWDTVSKSFSAMISQTLHGKHLQRRLQPWNAFVFGSLLSKVSWEIWRAALPWRYSGDSVCWHTYSSTPLTRKGDYLSTSKCVCVRVCVRARVCARACVCKFLLRQRRATGLPQNAVNGSAPHHPSQPPQTSLDSPQRSICETHSPCQTFIHGERAKNPLLLLNALWIVFLSTRRIFPGLHAVFTCPVPGSTRRGGAFCFNVQTSDKALKADLDLHSNS